MSAPRLVDDFQAGYLKFNGREPRTLEELAIARAEYKHRQDLAAIKALRGKLQLLDAFVEPLKAHGINLAYRDISTYDGGKTLRIQAPMSRRRDADLHAALIEHGFREIERKDWGSTEQMVTLKHGRSLVVSIDVPSTIEAMVRAVA